MSSAGRHGWYLLSRPSSKKFLIQIAPHSLAVGLLSATLLLSATRAGYRVALMDLLCATFFSMCYPLPLEVKYEVPKLPTLLFGE